MLGEVTPKIAETITSSPAFKLLIPLFQENSEIVGVYKETSTPLCAGSSDKLKGGEKICVKLTPIF